MFEENNRGLKISITIDLSNNCLVIVIAYEKKKKNQSRVEKVIVLGRREKLLQEIIAEIMNGLLFFV